MGSTWVFPSLSHSLGKCSKTYPKEGAWDINTHTFSKIWRHFLPSDFNSLVYFLTLGMHGFSYQYPIASENAAKPMLRGQSGKLVSIRSPKVWVLSWYLMVYFIPWQMHGYSHQYPIACYLHQNPFYGESLEIDSLNFPKLWFFSIRFPPYGVLYLMRNAWVFLSISHSIGKRNKTYRMGEIWDTYIPWTHILRYHGPVV